MLHAKRRQNVKSMFFDAGVKRQQETDEDVVRKGSQQPSPAGVRIVLLHDIDSEDMLFHSHFTESVNLPATTLPQV
jgi:hypothetical protein